MKYSGERLSQGHCAVVWYSRKRAGASPSAALRSVQRGGGGTTELFGRHAVRAMPQLQRVAFDVSPASAVDHCSARWNGAGTPAKTHHTLSVRCHEEMGRRASPSVGRPVDIPVWAQR